MIPYREAIINRDEGKCQICDTHEGRLEVHHIKHEISKIEDLVTLCKTCHTTIHLIEKTLSKGDVSYYCCGLCEDKPHLIEYRTRASKTKIQICPKCLSGIYFKNDVPLQLFCKNTKYIKKVKEYLETKGINFDNILNERTLAKPLFNIVDEVSYLLYTKNDIRVLHDPYELIRSFYEEVKKDNKSSIIPQVISMIDNFLTQIPKKEAF